MKTLFEEQEEDAQHEREPGESDRCTPEKLLRFIKETKAKTGKSPTMGELKAKFGGVLGPLMDAHTLREKGLL
jgi:hypothetical protein